MNKFSRTLLIVLGSNALIFGLSFALPALFIFFFLATALEILVGLVMLISKSSREAGSAVLVAGGIALLIGFSICSSMTYGGHF